ncbi:hypothetical protein MVEN_02005700 [Mycena venus]|uniref:Uncharacterized protein n=1 Tax=Mycena venus TaxID=2733690 RepID=A0A8H7CJN8_9AGAR|nr:hypothetical protein MVEN_02005700 [Mycena venus]
MLSSERTYVDLLFRASRKYASWDPEALDFLVKVGDWGRITKGRRGLAFWRKNGTFLKEGNIFSDGKAKMFEIPDPIEYGSGSEGETWVVSQNAQQVDVSSSVGVSPTIAQCKVKGAFKFSSGRGAVLVMENDIISAIDPPGALRRLLKDPQYAWLRGRIRGGSTIALGLSVEPPVSGVASATGNATWVRKRGFWKFQVPEKATSTGLRGESDESDSLPPLPDAEPPWDAEDAQITAKRAKFTLK